MLHTTITDYEWQQNIIHGKAHDKYGNFHQDWDFLLNSSSTDEQKCQPQKCQPQQTNRQTESVKQKHHHK